MCGISGYYKSARLDETHIQGLSRILEHRGPDHSGFFVDDRIFLAHNRLSIIDLSEGSNQPFHAQDGRHILLYNGEVYNYRELAAELSYTPKTSGDTEIVMAAYLKWGDDFVKKLNGMFAIVIYDRESGRIKVWRDRFGIKPFYYYWDGKDFAFASELKALYQLPFEKTLDREALSDYLFLEYIPQNHCIFKHFHKLGNGQVMIYDHNSVHLEKYYDILDAIHPINQRSEDEYLAGFEDLFQSSLQYRCISDVPVGAFLSGGTDSSAICAGLSSFRSEVSTFNIAFKDARYDESNYAKSVAEHLGTDHHQHELKASDMLHSLDMLMKQYDEPFAVSSIFPSYQVSKMAKENISVALSGDGGDELFMGYGHYRWYDRIKRLESLGMGLKGPLGKALSLLPNRHARLSDLLDFNSLDQDWPHIWSQEQYMLTEKHISSLTGTPYQNTYLRESWKDIQNVSVDHYQAISIFDIRHYLADDLLYKVDIASMANSLEVRLPFLDHRLVEYIVNMPSELKYRVGDQKHLLKHYLSKSLPSKLVNRKKWGFGAPVDSWMKNELKNMVQENLSEKAIKDGDVFDPDQVASLLKSFQEGRDHLYKKVWAILVFQLWQKRHQP